MVYSGLVKGILVTGAISFVARNIISGLAAQGYEIQGVVRTLSKSENDSIYLKSQGNIRPFVVGDLSNPRTLGNLSWRPDLILHLAASHSHKERDTIKLFRDNVFSLANILTFAQKVDCTKIISFSSVSVHGIVKSETLSHLTEFVNPDAYGLSKRVAEVILDQPSPFQSSYILRLPAIIGVGAKNHWIAKILESAKNGTDICVESPNNSFNNVIHVSDILKFILLLVERDDVGAFSFPIASSEPMKIYEVVDLILRLTESTSNLDFREKAKSGFTIDDSYAREKFGYTSLTTKSSIRQYVKDSLEKFQV